MKIHQLISGPTIALTNEENQFVQKHQEVKITSLDERDQWLAQTLVRKGVYQIGEDNNTLIQKLK